MDAAAGEHGGQLTIVATYSHITPMDKTIGIRELRDRLSHFLREVERTGTSITVTDHGRPIAELVPVAEPPKTKLQQLIDAGVAHPPRESGPIEIRWPGIRLPPGTAQQLIDEDRDERW
jgi:prevent-host-death family protein